MKIIEFWALIIIIVVSSNLNAQQITPEKLGLKAYSISDKLIGEINFFVSSNKINERKPVLIYLDGSGAFPLFQYTERGIGSTVPLDLKNLSDDFHIILISKPGVPFIDSVKMDNERGMPIYIVPKLYNEKLSLDWRVNSTILVLNNIMKTLKVDKKKITVLGISEGFQVAAKIASIENRVTHLILFVGNGLNQFYDFIVHNRTDAQNGIISEDEAQKNIDSLLIVAKDIYANPYSTDKEWYGHTYLRWSSFTNNTPTENINSLEIPVYIVAASNDRNSAVLSTDYLFLESIRQKKTNITYKVYPYDHSLNEYIKNEKGEFISVKSHLQDILNDSFNWLKAN